VSRRRLTLFASHNFTVLSAEDVANTVDPGRNLTSKMVSKCDSNAVTEKPVSR